MKASIFFVIEMVGFVSLEKGGMCWILVVV